MSEPSKNIETVKVLYGAPGTPEKLAEYIVASVGVKGVPPRVVTVAAPAQQIAVVITPAGINIARTRTPESPAGRSRLVTWEQARQFVESGELSAARYALIVNDELYDIFPSKRSADDKACDLTQHGNRCTIVAVSQEAAAKHLK